MLNKSGKITTQQIEKTILAGLMSVTGNYNETDLVLLLKQQDRTAFDYLYERYSGALYSVILNIVPDKETGNDILQEVFVKIWRQVEQYDPSKGRLFTWMLNIARNASIDFTRGKQFKNSRQNAELTDTSGVHRRELHR